MIKVFYVIAGIGIAGAIYFLSKHIKEKNKEVMYPSDVGARLDYYRQEPLVGIGHSYWQSV